MIYTTKQLARISGISRGQLIRWDGDGLLRPKRGRVRGKIAERNYTRAQALGVIALAELGRGGVSQKRIRAASAALPEAIEEGMFLIFDGWQLYPRRTAEEALALLEERPGSRVMRVAKLMERLIR